MTASATAGLPAVGGLYDGGLPVTQVFGLPLHPLLVHAAVVLLPLAAIGLILMASGIKRSKQYGALVVIVSAIAGVAAFLSMASGRDLASELVYGAQRHFELGEWLPWAGLVLFVVTLLLWLLDKKPSKRGLPGKVLAIIAVLVAIGVIVATVWVGHLGAELTWQNR